MAESVSRSTQGLSRERPYRNFVYGQRSTGAIQVPAADGLMRFWRNTSIAAMPAGERRCPSEHSALDGMQISIMASVQPVSYLCLRRYMC